MTLHTFALFKSVKTEIIYNMQMKMWRDRTHAFTVGTDKNFTKQKWKDHKSLDNYTLS